MHINGKGNRNILFKAQKNRERGTERQTEHKYVLMTVFVAKLFLGGFLKIHIC